MIDSYNTYTPQDLKSEYGAIETEGSGAISNLVNGGMVLCDMVDDIQGQIASVDEGAKKAVEAYQQKIMESRLEDLMPGDQFILNKKQTIACQIIVGVLANIPQPGRSVSISNTDNGYGRRVYGRIHGTLPRQSVVTGGL